MKEVVDSGVAKRTSKGKYSIIPFFIDNILKELEKKWMKKKYKNGLKILKKELKI